jgi:hypothetical protein
MRQLFLTSVAITSLNPQAGPGGSAAGGVRVSPLALRARHAHVARPSGRHCGAHRAEEGRDCGQARGDETPGRPGGRDGVRGACPRARGGRVVHRGRPRAPRRRGEGARRGRAEPRAGAGARPEEGRSCDGARPPGRRPEHGRAPASPQPDAVGAAEQEGPVQADAAQVRDYQGPSFAPSLRDRAQILHHQANIRNVPTPPPQAATPVAIAPVAASANPYTAAASTAAAEGALEGQGPRERVGRNFRFNQKGKYVALGDQLRKDAKLEEIKQRIADSARKAGLDGQFETVEKSIKAYTSAYIRIGSL